MHYDLFREGFEIGSSCKQEVKPEPNIPTGTAIERPILATSAVDQLPQETVDKFYPELNGTGDEVKSTLALEAEIPTKFYNFTQYSFNENAIRQMYSDIEFYAHLSEPILIPNPLEQDGSQMAAIGKPKIKSRTVIITEDMPSPFTSDEFTRNLNPSAATMVNASDEEFTFLKAIPSLFEDGSFATIEANVTLGMGIEICQQNIIAGVVDATGNLIMDREKARYAQEIICNNFGAAFAFRALGLSYEDYVYFAQTHRITDKEASFFAFPEETYNSLGAKGPIIQ